jgi:hypothetical protein
VGLAQIATPSLFVSMTTKEEKKKEEEEEVAMSNKLPLISYG